MSCQFPLLAGMAFAINLIALLLLAVVSVVLWRRHYRSRLIYLMPLLPITLAGTFPTLFGLLPCLNAP